MLRKWDSMQTAREFAYLNVLQHLLRRNISSLFEMLVISFVFCGFVYRVQTFQIMK